MKSFITTLLLLLSIQSFGAEKNETEPHKRVLFVGNSFSFYNNGIHNHFGNLIRGSGDWKRGENRVRLLTLSGGHFYEQLDAVSTHLKNDTRGYSAVVLQGHSNEPISKNKQKRFKQGVKEAVNIVRQQGLEPFLFMTWAYKGATEMSTQLANAYEEVGAELNVSVVPVGLAFEYVNENLPNVDLYVKDILGTAGDGEEVVLTYRENIKHPSTAGTYLAALVFYSYFFQESPVGIPYYAGLSQNTAMQLQEISWQIVSTYLNNKSQ